MIEDLSKLKEPAEEPVEVLDDTLQPVLWAFREDDTSPPHSYAFGYPCGGNLCLVPLKVSEAEEARILLWASPICKNEDDAKRTFFIIDQLLNALDNANAE